MRGLCRVLANFPLRHRTTGLSVSATIIDCSEVRRATDVARKFAGALSVVAARRRKRAAARRTRSVELPNRRTVSSVVRYFCGSVADCNDRRRRTAGFEDAFQSSRTICCSDFRFFGHPMPKNFEALCTRSTAQRASTSRISSSFSAWGNYVQLSDIALGFSGCSAGIAIHFPEGDYVRQQLAVTGRATTTIGGLATRDR